MKNYSSPLASAYLSEVLGLKHYLCPDSVYSIRSIKGQIPCQVLNVVFEPLDCSKYSLLKKIMVAIDVLTFSVLEVKDMQTLNFLFAGKQWLAYLVCVFGGSGLNIPKSVSLVDACSFGFADEIKIDFLQFCALKELNGDSLDIRNKKKHIWQELKKYKNALKQTSLVLHNL